MVNTNGAHAPNNIQWMIGKNKMSIDFVNQAEQAIEKLQKLVKDIKEGKEVIKDDFLPSFYLRGQEL